MIDEWSLFVAEVTYIQIHALEMLGNGQFGFQSNILHHSSKLFPNMLAALSQYLIFKLSRPHQVHYFDLSVVTTLPKNWYSAGCIALHSTRYRSFEIGLALNLSQQFSGTIDLPSLLWSRIFFWYSKNCYIFRRVDTRCTTTHSRSRWVRLHQRQLHWC